MTNWQSEYNFVLLTKVLILCNDNLKTKGKVIITIHYCGFMKSSGNHNFVIIFELRIYENIWSHALENWKILYQYYSDGALQIISSDYERGFVAVHSKKISISLFFHQNWTWAKFKVKVRVFSCVGRIVSSCLC